MAVHVAEALIPEREILLASIKAPEHYLDVLQRLPHDRRKILRKFSADLNRVIKDSCPPGTMEAFIASLTGVVPQPNDLETYPAPVQSGLCDGDSTLFLSVLEDCPNLARFLHREVVMLWREGEERLEGGRDGGGSFNNKVLGVTPVMDALRSANMLYVQLHPLDHEAQIRSRTSSAMAAVETTSEKAINSDSDDALGSGPVLSSSFSSKQGSGLRRRGSLRGGRDGTAADARSQVMRKDRHVDPNVEMGKKVRRLVMLNMSMKHDPMLWAPVLEVIEEAIDTLDNERYGGGEYGAAFADCPRLSAAIEVLVSGLSLPPTSLNPKQLVSYTKDRLYRCMAEVEAVKADGFEAMQSPHTAVRAAVQTRQASAEPWFEGTAGRAGSVGSVNGSGVNSPGTPLSGASGTGVGSSYRLVSSAPEQRSTTSPTPVPPSSAPAPAPQPKRTKNFSFNPTYVAEAQRARTGSGGPSWSKAAEPKKASVDKKQEVTSASEPAMRKKPPTKAEQRRLQRVEECCDHVSGIVAKAVAGLDAHQAGDEYTEYLSVQRGAPSS